ncbi:porin [Paracoccus sp. p4-l81]|uniref:porin n=1 Tax=unclassified Paracoccus (in: a-proteobacteria) TaxID=2688777 RepID=UPI0035B6B34D
MKKVLFATTALILSAGFAQAEVAVSGDGRMGLVYNGDDMNFSSRVRVKFTLTGESDSGLSFGGNIRADNAAAGAKGYAGDIWVSGAFGKIAMGDVVGAAEEIHGDLPEIGFTDIAANDIGFITGDGARTSENNPVLLYTYSMGDMDFAASLNDGVTYTAAGAKVKNQEYALGFGYKFGTTRLGLAYEAAKNWEGGNETAKLLSVSAAGEFSNVKGGIYYAKGSGAIDGVKEYGIGAASTFGATTVKGMIRVVDATTKTTYWGLGAEYDLGGGASIVGGIADNDMETNGVKTKAVADLGLKFKF